LADTLKDKKPKIIIQLLNLKKEFMELVKKNVFVARDGREFDNE
jgi:hypothetical protein